MTLISNLYKKLPSKDIDLIRTIPASGILENYGNTWEKMLEYEKLGIVKIKHYLGLVIYSTRHFEITDIGEKLQIYIEEKLKKEIKEQVNHARKVIRKYKNHI